MSGNIVACFADNVHEILVELVPASACYYMCSFV